MYKVSKRRQKVWLANHRKLRNKYLTTCAQVEFIDGMEAYRIKYDDHEYLLQRNHPKLYQRLVDRPIQWVPEGYYDRAFYFKSKR